MAGLIKIPSSVKFRNLLVTTPKYKVTSLRRGAIKPAPRNRWGCAPKPGEPQLPSPHTGAGAPQQRGHHREKPVRAAGEEPGSPQPEGSLRSREDPAYPETNEHK